MFNKLEYVYINIFYDSLLKSLTSLVLPCSGFVKIKGREIKCIGILSNVSDCKYFYQHIWSASYVMVVIYHQWHAACA